MLLLFSSEFSERNDTGEPEDQDDAEDADADYNVAHFAAVFLVNRLCVLQVLLCFLCVTLRFDQVRLDVVKDLSLLLDELGELLEQFE